MNFLIAIILACFIGSGFSFNPNVGHADGALILITLAYLIGSIPFGLIVTRLAGLGDIRNIGSGNIGATNVLRTGHKKLAAMTLVLDAGKGFAAVSIMWIVISLTGSFGTGGEPIRAVNLPYDRIILYAPLVAVIGHIFPVWLRFRGGKGVATALGSFLALFDVISSCRLGETMLAVWLLVFFLSRYSSLASLTSLWLVPLGYAVYYYDDSWVRNAMLAATLPVSLLITWRHKDNIRRLLDGTEPSFGKNAA